MLPLTTAVIGILLGLGGLRDFLIDGTWNGRLQPLLVGAASAMVASLRLLAMAMGVGIGVALLAYVRRERAVSLQLVQG